VLFADVRGSTPLAESMPAADFGKLINRFYTVATDVLVRTNAWVDRLVGDQAIGIYVPGFAGPDHSALALEAARELLRATGHDGPEEPWLPVGVGVHRGVAFVGAVGTKDGVCDITVLGDVPNVGARLSSAARSGEILVSEAANQAGHLHLDGAETCELDLKGKREPVAVRRVRLG
jgi:adenylate cyclase